MDIERYFLTHGQALKSVPDLTAKSLRNWSEQGLIDCQHEPGRGNFRRYSPLGVIKLAVMHDLTQLRIAAPSASEIAETVLHHVRQFVALNGGFTLDPIPQRRSRAAIWRVGNSYRVSINTAGWCDPHSSPTARIVLEINQLTVETLNRIRNLGEDERAEEDEIQ